MAAIEAPAAAKPTRRGAKSKLHDDPPMETSVPDTTLPGADDPAANAKVASPATGRRGRKPKSDAMAADHDSASAAAPAEAVPAIEPELPAVEAKTPKPRSSPRTTRRNREPEASAPPPLEIVDEQAADSHAAAEWHAASGTVTFDWPAIEQVAASEGPNQPMAKLLLAARAEGATSRWPF
jgi:hypothetical protein